MKVVIKVRNPTKITKISRMFSCHSENRGKGTFLFSTSDFFSIAVPNPTNSPNNYPA